MPKSLLRSGNRVLARLSQADFALLKPHLERVDLPLSTMLETGGQRIDAVYFIDHGFASVVADGRGKRDIEVGIIGRESMTGLALALGQDRARYTTYIQVAGAGTAQAPPSCARHGSQRRPASGSLAGSTPFSTRPRKRRSPTAAAKTKDAWRAGCSWHTTAWMARSYPSRTSFLPSCWACARP
jgi:CRP-like cAMP-binding protein